MLFPGSLLEVFSYLYRPFTLQILVEEVTSPHLMDEMQAPLAINTELKSVTNSELLNLAILFQKRHYFGFFQQYLF